ncbi:MAG: coiled-coil domain-containing protein, partial [Promethearchaeota archaeon]
FENKVADLESTTSNSKEQTDKLTAEIQELNNKLSATQDENTNLNSQLMELNNILLQKDTKIQELTDNIDSKEKLVDAQTARLEEVETELGELKPPELGSGGFATEERTTCPMCGAVGHNIKQIEDKTKVLSYVGHIPMYAKKHVCKKCGYEF